MKKKNIILRIVTNAYVKSILLMLVIVAVLIAGLALWLKEYTRHSESVAVPLIKSLQVEEAAVILRNQGLKYEIIDSLYQTTGTPGAILEQIPVDGSSVKKGRTIFLITQAKNVPLVSIPSLKDFSYRQAEAKLRSLGFNNIVIQEKTSQYKGLVLAIEYQGSALEPNQKVPKGARLNMTIGAGGLIVIDSINTPAIDPAFLD